MATFTKNCEFELFFTATVLQHCPLDAVARIFLALSQTRVSVVSLYENCGGKVRSPHVEGRSSRVYLDLLSQHVQVCSYTENVQCIHGEEHVHILAKLKGG